MIKLEKPAHVTQLLGDADFDGNYILPTDIASTVRKMRKVPVVMENEINIGNDSTTWQSKDKVCELPVNFYMEKGILYLDEQVCEMGGLLALTYLTPIAEVNEDYVKEIGDVDLTALTERVNKKRERKRKLMEDQERLCKPALRKAQKFLRDNKAASVDCALAADEFENLLKQSRRFIRPGKQDYNQAQLQMMNFILEKNKLKESTEMKSLVELIDKCKMACERKSLQVLKGDLLAKAYKSKAVFTPSGGKVQNFNFGGLLAGLVKKEKFGASRGQFEKEYPDKSKKIMDVYNLQEEMEEDIELDERLSESEQIPDETQTIVTEGLNEYRQNKRTGRHQRLSKTAAKKEQLQAPNLEEQKNPETQEKSF